MEKSAAGRTLGTGDKNNRPSGGLANLQLLGKSVKRHALCLESPTECRRGGVQLRAAHLEDSTMTLRTRLFLLFGGLLAALALAQQWWAQTLTAELSDELGEVAVSVGSSVAQIFIHQESPEDSEDESVEHEVILEELLETEDDPGAKPRKVIVLDQRKVFRQSDAKEDAEDDAAPPREVHVRRMWVDDEEHQIHLAPDSPHHLALLGPDLEHRIPIPEEGFRAALDRFTRRLFWGTFGFLGLGLLLVGAVAHRVTSPLRRLSDAARRVGGGELGIRVAATAKGEVGEAIHAFDAMSERLALLDARNRELAAREHLGEIGEIARGLAHSLRNPLNALGLSVEELAGRVDGEEGVDLAAAARRQIRRIDGSVRSFLALASQGGGAVERVRIDDLARDVALEALQDARGKVRLDVAVDGDPPPLPAVEPELRAVLQALVVNAVEAAPDGTTVHLRILAPGELPDQLRVEIDDDGPGLPEEIRRHLFTPHQTTKAHGSGMGLYLAQRIAATRYGGGLELLDRDGGGTRAVLELGPRRGGSL